MSDLKEKSGRTRKTDRTFTATPIIPMKREKVKAYQRPLRTYSKRVAPTDSTEPVAKRQRTNEAQLTPQIAKSSDKLNTDVSAVSEPILPAIPPTAPSRKGTITAYFKKIDPPTSSSMLPSEASSDNIEPIITTPPSSPPALNTRRKRARRLTTRAVSRDNAEHGNEEDERTEESKEEKQVSAKIEELSSPENQDILTSVGSHALNRMETITRKRSEAGKRGKTTTVQTTLSLSLTDTGFVECQECNMIYNPIHEKDAKDHARVHAALQRAKSRTRTTATD